MKRYHHLTREQRYTIQCLRKSGKNQSEVARILKLNRSTICRELKRNRAPTGGYLGHCAQNKMAERKRNRALSTRRIKGWLEKAILEKLYLDWSPQQICQRLKLEGRRGVSHEAIYRYIYWHRLGHYLRFGGRRRKNYGTGKRFVSKIPERVFIDKRPKSIGKRRDFGHWERDFMEGKRHRAPVLALVERKSRFILIKQVKKNTTSRANRATLALIKKYPSKFKTITNDNGATFADHKKLSAKAGIKIYFSNPYASWERGSVENAIGLIRQYLPKGMCLKNIRPDYLQYIENRLNLRPKSVLGYRTPQEKFSGKLMKLFK